MEYGALAGASFGVLYGIGAAGKSGEQHGVGDWIVAGIVVGGGAGAVVGFISGLIVGYSYEYELPTTEQGDSLKERK